MSILYVKKVGLVILFAVTVFLIGLIFTSVRTTSLSSETFEAQPITTYQNASSIDDLFNSESTKTIKSVDDMTD